MTAFAGKWSHREGKRNDAVDGGQLQGGCPRLASGEGPGLSRNTGPDRTRGSLSVFLSIGSPAAAEREETQGCGRREGRRKGVEVMSESGRETWACCLPLMPSHSHPHPHPYIHLGTPPPPIPLPHHCLIEQLKEAVASD